MITLEKHETMGWEHAVRGARNPMNSWHLSDSKLDYERFGRCGSYPKLGPNDYKLLTKLAEAGSDHRKYMRMIIVYVDITAPLYWWKEFDTYKVGTVANSCSTMHKIHAKEFVRDDFSHGTLCDVALSVLDTNIRALNLLRDTYLEHKEKFVWDQIIQLLPSSYNQKRTVMMNYEVLRNMYHARKNHKLAEWREFCEWIETLPYSELITGPRELKKAN